MFFKTLFFNFYKCRAAFLFDWSLSVLGGTNVSGALLCPENEQRPIVSLDMTEMDKILWIDEENLTAHIEGGIIGQDLERKVSDTAIL